jgi:L-ascorbate metabolism protein UlaG (beta-lactamase superfamily)
VDDPPAGTAAALFSFASASGTESRSADGPRIIDMPGEFEVSGAFVIGVQASRTKLAGEDKDDDRCQVYCVEMDGLTACHLGELGRKLSQAQVEALGEVHALLLPLERLGIALASELVAQIEPAYVVPLTSSEDPAAMDMINAFSEQMGAAGEPLARRLIIDKSRLSGEPTLVLLEGNR